MPLIHVRRDKDMVNDKILEQLADLLPQGVAWNLSADSEDPDTALTPHDIPISFFDEGKFDVMTHPLEITIFANHYPARADDLQERVKAIVRYIEDESSGIKGKIDFYVWVLLSVGGFSEKVYSSTKST